MSNLPYHLEIPSGTLLAIMPNVFEAPCLPAQCKQHKYSADTVVQAVANIY